jgi:hypothetical protein
MQCQAWGVLWRSVNRLDGQKRALLGDVTAPHGDGHPVVKPAGAAQSALTFKTRAAALAFINDRYGYIRDRADLRREPHGWRMPIPVRVRITVEEI